MQKLQVLQFLIDVDCSKELSCINRLQSASDLEGYMTMFGYARVSTRDQDFAGQVAELTAVGCARVFREKASGAKRDRAELTKVIAKLEVGDVLAVTRLDRLARSKHELL